MNNQHKQEQRRAFLMKATQAAIALTASGWRNEPVFAEDGKIAAMSPPEAIEATSAKPSPPIRIGVLLGTFRSGSLAARLDGVKASGLDCVQLSMDCAGVPAMPDEISRNSPNRFDAKLPRAESQSRPCRARSICAIPTLNIARLGYGDFECWPKPVRKWGFQKFTCVPARETARACGGDIPTTTRQKLGETWLPACVWRLILLDRLELFSHLNRRSTTL